MEVTGRWGGESAKSTWAVEKWVQSFSCGEGNLLAYSESRLEEGVLKESCGNTSRCLN